MTVKELRIQQIAQDEAVLQTLISIRRDLDARIMKVEDRLARERDNLRRSD